MTLFYLESANKDLGVLPKEEAKHAIRVLRLTEGDLLGITNGKGDIFTAAITLADQKNCEIKIIEQEHFEPKPYSIHMVVAPTKLNDRFEWMLEKMTEIGVNEITPIICDHSERKVIKQERMERIIQSAVKQSWKAHKPILNPSIKFKDFITQNKFDQQFIAHCNGGCGSDVHLKKLAQINKHTAVLIGPEGDFSEKEVELAHQNGWVKIGLGSERLRTETAALYACTTLNLIQE